MLDEEEDNKEKERTKEVKKKSVVGKILRSTLSGHARISPDPPHIWLGHGDLWTARTCLDKVWITVGWFLNFFLLPEQ